MSISQKLHRKILTQLTKKFTISSVYILKINFKQHPETSSVEFQLLQNVSSYLSLFELLFSSYVQWGRYEGGLI